MRQKDEVYCLFSTRDGQPNYVGCSDNSDLRLGKHLSAACRSAGLRVGKWIRHEWLSGFQVEHLPLDQFDSTYNNTEDMRIRESRWIAILQPMTNERKTSSGRLSLPSHDVEKVVQTSRRMARTRIFNRGGTIGIHYDRSCRGYLAHVCWQYPDGIIGRKFLDDGYFFESFQEAVVARNAFRQDLKAQGQTHPNFEWPPDLSTADRKRSILLREISKRRSLWLYTGNTV